MLLSFSSTILDRIQDYCLVMKPIVVMHDFFIDRIIRLSSTSSLVDILKEKSAIGGGSIRNIPTIDVKGGNAVNVAYCLAKFGAKVNLFTVTNNIGSSVLKSTFYPYRKTVNLFLKKGHHGCTTSFEFYYKKNNNSDKSFVNIMFSDIGDVANFGPDLLNSKDLNALQNSSAIVIVNWASNLKGTQLVTEIFAKSNQIFHYLDPADIETRKEEFVKLLDRIQKNLDVLSINENEFNSIMGMIDKNFVLQSGYTSNEVKKAVTMLSKHIKIKIDLHTRIGAAWSDGNIVEFVASINNDHDIRSTTGAGDCWDASNVLGYLAGLTNYERLLFANLSASLYIHNEFLEPPSINLLHKAIKYKKTKNFKNF